MSGAQETAPQSAAAGDPTEDLRRDEVLCRLLNTPYRPAHRPSAASNPPSAAPAMPVRERTEG